MNKTGSYPIVQLIIVGDIKWPLTVTTLAVVLPQGSVIHTLCVTLRQAQYGL